MASENGVQRGPVTARRQHPPQEATVSVVVALVIVLVLGALAARYGADSRSDTGSDPRDPARPHRPQYAHTPAEDLRVLVGALRARE
jgi:hypothetical protein